MGGTNEIRILGFRAHVSGNEVHLHNDDGIKYRCDLRTFKSEIEEASRTLMPCEGALEISGADGVSLIVGKNGDKTFVALTTSSNAVDDLKRWVEGC